jgi:hypothetical protein
MHGLAKRLAFSTAHAWPIFWRETEPRRCMQYGHANLLALIQTIAKHLVIANYLA